MAHYDVARTIGVKRMVRRSVCRIGTPDVTPCHPKRQAVDEFFRAKEVAWSNVSAGNASPVQNETPSVKYHRVHSQRPSDSLLRPAVDGKLYSE